MVICPRCQMQNADEAFQCSRCGIPLKKGQQNQQLPLYKTNYYNGRFVAPNNSLTYNMQFKNMNNGFAPTSSMSKIQQPVNPYGYCKQGNSQKTEYISKKQKNKKRGGLFPIIIILVFLLVFIGMYFLITLIILPANKYNLAVEMMNKGEYENAIETFNNMGSYKDSELKIIACQNLIKDRQYDIAVQTMNNGDFEAAIVMFTELNEYHDSKLQIELCEIGIKDSEYNDASNLMISGNYSDAITAFKHLGNYKDSREKIKECQYQIASNLMSSGDYADAITAFKDLDDYKDSQEKAKEYQYQKAIKDIEKENYAEAYKALSTIGEYKDSKTKLNSVWDEYKKSFSHNSEIEDTFAIDITWWTLYYRR